MGNPRPSPKKYARILVILRTLISNSPAGRNHTTVVIEPKSRNWAGMMSRRSETSSPIRCRLPQQQGQTLDQNGPALWPDSARRALPGAGAPWTLEDNDFRRGASAGAMSAPMVLDTAIHGAAFLAYVELLGPEHHPTQSERWRQNTAYVCLVLGPGWAVPLNMEAGPLDFTIGGSLRAITIIRCWISEH